MWEMYGFKSSNIFYITRRLSRMTSRQWTQSVVNYTRIHNLLFFFWTWINRTLNGAYIENKLHFNIENFLLVIYFHLVIIIFSSFILLLLFNKKKSHSFIFIIIGIVISFFFFFRACYDIFYYYRFFRL